MRCALIFAWAAGLAVGAAYDPAEVLERARQKVLAGAKDTPNYTCVETVTREYFKPVAATLPRACAVLLEQRQHPALNMVMRLYSTDRLRLDVTMASNGEIFSWSGAKRFEDAAVDSVVRDGPMATGSFGGFMAAVFKTDVKRFTFERNLEGKGRILMEYSFRVEKPDSHYGMRLYDAWVFIPYSGTLRVDPESADLVGMTVTSGETPPATGLCLITTTMDFAKVQIGGGRFLLPERTSQHFVYPNIQEAENTTAFTNCREFRGESTVNFSPEKSAAVDGAISGSAKEFALPRGLPFSIQLTTPIQSGTAAAGDPFSAKLVDALRDDDGKLLARKGTLVEGRLLRVQSFVSPPEVVVVLRPEALRIGGARVPLTAVQDWTYVMAQKRRQGRGLEIALPLRGEKYSGAFHFSGEQVTVPAGFRSDWKTVVAGAPVTSR